jgi:PAS domain S-box-containing protein
MEMRSLIAGRGRHTQLGATWIVPGAALLLVVALWSGLAFFLAGDRARAREGGLRDTAAVAKLVEEHAIAAIRQVDELTARIKDSYERFGSGYDWFEMVTGRRAASAPFFASFSILDADGRLVVASSERPGFAKDLAGREDFLAQARGDNGFHIGRLVSDPRTQKLTIPFTRRLENPDGSFAGVVVVEVDTAYFVSFYAAIGLVPDSAVILTRSDGPLLARHPLNDQAVGKSFTRSAVWPAIRRHETGHYEAASAVDGIERIYAFRNSAEYPIFMVVGFPKSAVFAGWQRRTESSVVALLALTLAILVGAGFLMRQLQHRVASEAKHRAIFESAVDGIVTTDEAGIISTMNPAAESMFGHAAADVIGRHLSIIFPGAGDGGSAWENAARHGTSEGEIVARRKDGSDFPVEVAVAKWQAGVQTFFSGVVRDIGDRKRFEAELRAARDVAESASRAKSAFLANMSHELRTPLNAVIGFADLLTAQRLGPPDSARYAEYAADIRASGQHLLQLINDILDLSKAEAGHLVLHEEDVDLEAAIGTCRRMLAATAEERRVTIECRIALEATLLRGDETRIRQILLNLLSNAVKFTPQGGRISIEAFADGDTVVLRISDTGIGIASEDMAKVLTPFGQVDSALNRATAGTGLGLPLTKRLVELHGGALEIASERGEGTTVTIRLPAARVLRQVA